MIPRDFVTEWRAQAPWPDDAQVEQDLVICRALVDIFSHPVLSQALAFRGGTALYKLYLKPAARYSEDIDLVQVRAEPAGDVIGHLREVFDPWLGPAKWKQSEGRFTLTYRFEAEGPPAIPLRLKIEINTREHFSVHGFTQVPFSVASRWFAGRCDITTYDLDELMGTKLRALYQRRKGRDLFDMYVALTQGKAEPARIVTAFSSYMAAENHVITRAQFEENLALKMADARFLSDISPLLTADQSWEPARAAALIGEHLVARLHGDPWKAPEGHGGKS